MRNGSCKMHYYCSECSRHYNDERPWHIELFREWGMCGSCYITRDKLKHLVRNEYLLDDTKGSN